METLAILPNSAILVHEKRGPFPPLETSGGIGTVTNLKTEGCSDILMEDMPLGKTGEIL